ncbi:hypothetical protein [Thalassospira profundimaris]|uniref:Uncharacterized protein n=1 Tax=Thalassospira profundimaris TaxID=502049 RepID=A0A367WPB0_9PROT|nr:hypothetical protein [Thalassospira profundimaris]RCK43218.1 hypothetical protein TH30_19570 [Thalassospira profundimaris]
MAVLVNPHPDPGNLIEQQLAGLPDHWIVVKAGAGWASLEPTRGWYEIDAIPEDIKVNLPPAAGQLNSHFLPQLIAQNIENMPGNIDNLPIGWFDDACAVLTSAKPETPPAAKSSTTSRKRTRRNPEALKAIRLELQNALAGLYEDPGAACARIERALQRDDSTFILTLLNHNPDHFGSTHSIKRRWWHPDIEIHLQALEDLSS